MKPIRMMSAREQVTMTLRKAIFNGEFKDGEEIRQEDIAAKLGVSRMPVREAFMLLERDGLITMKTNKRAAVKIFTDEDFIDHYEIRALLEGEAAARAAFNNPNIDEMDLILEELDKSTAHGDSAAFVSANEAFHRAIWRASGSKQLESLLSQLWGGLPTHLPELLPDQMEKSTKEHKEILETIKLGKSAEAKEKITKHLERSKNAFILHKK